MCIHERRVDHCICGAVKMYLNQHSEAWPTGKQAREVVDREVVDREGEGIAGKVVVTVEEEKAAAQAVVMGVEVREGTKEAALV